MKVIGTILAVILTSLFYFPFNTSLLPAVNTKMFLAAIGLVLFMFNSSRKQNAEIKTTFGTVSVWAALVSFVGLIAALVNDSGDYTYASYIVSAWVWMGGAYTVIKFIESVFGKVSLRILTNILVLVCVSQCILSQIINSNPLVADWVDSFMVSTGFMGKPDGRLYGIGCALDVAGLKFCVVLMLLAYFAMHPSRKINVYWEIILYMAAFAVICIFGSMISRTTSIGVMLVLAYWIVVSMYKRESKLQEQYKSFWQIVLVSLLLLIPIIIYFYHTNSAFYTNLRFGFEGFFSLVETGEWKVRSNSQLMSMWVWPDNLKTWLIGDGYFGNPLNTNPYYIGPASTDYYMGTDVGYCRFVFCFGLIGLAVFSLYFFICAKCCSNNMPQYKMVFWMILLMNFVGWYKVSSDIFPIYALLLLLDKEPIESHTEELAEVLEN